MNAAYRHLILTAVFLIAPSCKGAERKTGSKMETPIIELPFHLKAQDLLKVEFAFEYFPSNSKTWIESIRISGATGVTLVRHIPGATKPDTLHAKCEPQALITLLKLYEDNGFFEKEVDVNGESSHSIQFLSLNIPGQFNRVAVGGRYQSLLGTLVGAIRLAAGFTLPEALDLTLIRES